MVQGKSRNFFIGLFQRSNQASFPLVDAFKYFACQKPHKTQIRPRRIWVCIVVHTNFFAFMYWYPFLSLPNSRIRYAHAITFKRKVPMMFPFLMRFHLQRNVFIKIKCLQPSDARLDCFSSNRLCAKCTHTKDGLKQMKILETRDMKKKFCLDNIALRHFCG